FRQDFVPRAVPIKLTTGLVDPAAVAVPGCPGVTKNENRNSKNEIRPPRHPPGFVDLAAWGLAVVHELPVSLRLLVESEGRAHRCESGIDILLGELRRPCLLQGKLELIFRPGKRPLSCIYNPQVVVRLPPPAVPESH